MNMCEDRRADHPGPNSYILPRSDRSTKNSVISAPFSLVYGRCSSGGGLRNAISVWGWVCV